MPRTIPLVCSGICLLLTSTLSAQAPLPKHSTPQQVVGYALRQQRAWNHKQLPVNSVLFKADPSYTASHGFLHQRNLMDLPAYDISYGFTIRPSYSFYPDYKEAFTKDPYEALKIYLARDRIYFGEKQRSAWLYEPSEGIGSFILSNLLRRYPPPPPSPYIAR